MVFDYLDAGADDEISLRRGKDAYTELEMHFKVLSGIKPPLDKSTKIFGMDVDEKLLIGRGESVGETDCWISVVIEYKL